MVMYFCVMKSLIRLNGCSLGVMEDTTVFIRGEVYVLNDETFYTVRGHPFSTHGRGGGGGGAILIYTFAYKWG